MKRKTKPDNISTPSSMGTNRVIIPLSAKNKDRLRESASNLLSYLRRQSYLKSGNHIECNLTNISYTLQVGREAMEERLGLIVSSLKELEKNLEDFVNGQDAIDDLYLGRIKRKQEAATGFTTDKNWQKAMDDWIAKGKLSKLLNLWVMGFEVNWQKLYGKVKPKRISLPTYPFAKERYWIPKYDGKSVASFGSKPSVNESLIAIESKDQNNRSAHSVLEYLKHTIHIVSKVPLNRIKPDIPFEEFGIDSIMISQLAMEIAAKTGVQDSTLFFKFNSLETLSKYLSEAFPNHFLSIDDEKPPAKQYSNDGNIQHQEPKGTQASLKTGLKAAKKRKAYLDKREIDFGMNAFAVPEDVVIVAMSGCFPKSANVEEFWRHLVNGDDCITEIPSSRWDWRDFYSEKKGAPGKMNTKYGGFIDDIFSFDPQFFNIIPNEVLFMDPQERLMLLETWKCLELYGYNRRWEKDKAPKVVGVFIGASFNNYQLLFADLCNGEHYMAPSQTFSIANRISYHFNFTGPSMVVDTACSSSLYALHLACQSLWQHECEMAIVGGVNLNLHPSKFITLSMGRFLSSDGHCHAFAKGGDGYVPSEGVAAVLIKRISDVTKEDMVLAHIKTTAVSHDGHTRGFTIPNPASQSLAIQSALNRADINARTITCFEAHGTGTELGDPIEITALQDVYGQYTQDKQYCAVSSVKANMGHMEATAGLSSLIKGVLQLQQKTKVPNPLHGNVNPNIRFSETAFYVVQDIEEWTQPRMDINGASTPIPLRLGVNSFGAGGGNVHVILEETSMEQFKEKNAPEVGIIPLILLSGKTKHNLLSYIEKLRYMLTSSEYQLAFNEICIATQCYRSEFSHRLSVQANCVSDLLKRLESIAAVVDFEELKTRKIEGLIYGNTNQSNMIVLGNHDQTMAYVRRLIRKASWETIASLWINGVSLGLEGYYSQHLKKHNFRPLFAYPFSMSSFGRDEIAALVRADDNSIPSKKAKYAIPEEVSTLSGESLIEPHDWLLHQYWTKENINRRIDQNDGRTICVFSNKTEVLEAFQAIEDMVKLWLIHGNDTPDDICFDGMLSKENITRKKIMKLICSDQKLGYLLVDFTKHPGNTVRRGNPTDKRIADAVTWVNMIIFSMDYLINNNISVIFLFPYLCHDHADPIISATIKYISFLKYEYAELSLSIIGTSSVDQVILKNLLQEIKHQKNELVVYLTDSDRYVQRIAHQEIMDIGISSPLDLSGSMIITGGFSGIGFMLLEWLIRQGAKNFVILGRKSLTSNIRHPWLTKHIRISEYIKLRSKEDISIHYLQCDLTDEGFCKDAFNLLRVRLKKPIIGVFCLAGVTTDSIYLKDTSKQLLSDIIAPKLNGAITLHHVTKNDPIKYFCLFSSVSAVEGLHAPGLSAYAASNAALNAVAQKRINEGRPVQLIHWTNWEEAGMTMEYNHSSFLNYMGISMLKPSVGFNILTYILENNIKTSTVFHVNWSVYKNRNTLVQTSPFFSEYSKKMNKRHPDDMEASQADIAKKSFGTKSELSDFIRCKLSRYLHKDIEDIQPSDSFDSLGLNSINVVEFFSMLSETIDQEIQPQVVFRHPTIDKLADHIFSKIAIVNSNASNSSLADELSHLIETVNAKIKKF